MKWAIRLLVVLGILGMSSGCAIINAGYDVTYYKPIEPALQAYSRNTIVCVPTAVGNIVGSLVGFPFLIAGYYFDDARKPLLTIGLFPVLVGGFVTGTLFLPFSYLAPEDPCQVGA